MQNQLTIQYNTHTDYASQFKQDGYVVIENALSEQFVKILHCEFMKAMEAKVKRFNLKRVESNDGREHKNNKVKIDFRPEGGNHDLNRWNMHLPSSSIFLNEKLIANSLVLETIEHFLGNDEIAFILASDTPYPGSGFQSIHQDFPRFGITVNIPLVDFTEENAPIEIWPGTHTYKNGQSQDFHTNKVDLSKEEIDEIVTTIPSKRMLIKAGSILIRDQRLVHRGTANYTDQPRPCLSLWYKSLNEFSIKGLTIPVPHREISNYFAKIAMILRTKGRGNNGSIKKQKLLVFGNFFGRVVEEMSGSDRDYRRSIPQELWESFSPKLKSLLRYASIEKPHSLNSKSQEIGQRSWLGTLLMSVLGACLSFYGYFLLFFGRARNK
jgi:ectoine hydroxylase-related dioxygenase (phytanoyl-CoA dioxygenase family)